MGGAVCTESSYGRIAGMATRHRGDTAGFRKSEGWAEVNNKILK